MLAHFKHTLCQHDTKLTVWATKRMALSFLAWATTTSMQSTSHSDPDAEDALEGHLLRDDVRDHAIVINDLSLDGCFALKGDRGVQIQSDLALGEHPHLSLAHTSFEKNALAMPPVRGGLGMRPGNIAGTENLVT